MADHICFNPEALINKIKHFLITTFGKVEKDATDLEFYQALCFSLREEIMINWTATKRSVEKNKGKTVNYISMEFLPGKFMQNNITNLQSVDLINSVLKIFNRNLSDLVEYDPDVGLGNGGLGRLGACFLDSLATQKIFAVGYGLKYQYGIFVQELWEGVQIERPDCWLLNRFPWEFRKDANAVTVNYRGKVIFATNSHGDEVYQLEDSEEVRAIPYDIPIVGYSQNPNFAAMTLRLWSTKESPRNFQLQRFNAGDIGQAGENTSLTDVLYPNDNNEVGKRIRLKQEFLLVCASLKDILNDFYKTNDNINLFPDKVQIQLNDTHPALVIAELMHALTKNHDIPWKKAWEITTASCNYTNHTIMKEALEEWNETRLQALLPRQYRIIQRINMEFCDKVRERFPLDEERVKRMSCIQNGQIKMAHLAIHGCKKVNGVAHMHTEILKNEIFKDFYEMYPDKFISITNGVTPRRWLLNCNPKLSEFITKRIGPDWTTNFLLIEKLHAFASDKASAEEFLAIKKRNKHRLLSFLAQENPIRDFKGKIIAHSAVLDEDAIFDVHIKRFHEYKRQLLNALHILVLTDEIRQNPDSRKVKRMAIIGGKAAPGYEMAKHIILLFHCISRKIISEPAVSEKLRIAFVENYNVSKAEIIIPAADISEQISTAGFEASGTGNMKLSMNGALTVGTDDGANIEMRQAVTDQWWPFSFGAKAEELIELKKSDRYHPVDIYKKNPEIKKAIDTLKNGSLAKNDSENIALNAIADSLLNEYNKPGDPYFVLKDFDAYYATQKKVEELYCDQYKWAEYAIHNIASMGRFSSDIVIKNYAKEIWEAEPCSLDQDILFQVRKEYTEFDRCIVPTPIL